MTMYDLLEKNIEKNGDLLFLVRENITFGDLPKYITARAASLADVGVKAGDTVGVLSHNLPQFIYSLFAIWYLGKLSNKYQGRRT